MNSQANFADGVALLINFIPFPLQVFRILRAPYNFCKAKKFLLFQPSSLSIYPSRSKNSKYVLRFDIGHWKWAKKLDAHLSVTDRQMDKHEYFLYLFYEN